LNIEIRPFDLVHASSSDWSRMGEFHSSIERDLYPDQPPTSLDAWKGLTQTDMQQQDMLAYEAVDLENNERIVAFMRLIFWKESSPSYRGNEHICNMAGIGVLDEYRRSGIATKFLPLIHDEVKARGRRSIVGPIVNDAARIFVRKIGGTEALAMRDNRLNLDSVDWNMVNSWVKEGPKRSPGTGIKFFQSIPDKMLKQFCNVYTEVSNQAPRDQLKVGDQVTTPEYWKAMMKEWTGKGWKYFAALTMEGNGDISGLTDVLWIPSQPSILMQLLTGVQERYRGRGLGKWLKGAVLLRVRKEFPPVTTIVTQNATSNEPMLAINEQLGFKKYKEVYQFQLELDDLRKFLER